jgi:hypothetical protein
MKNKKTIKASEFSMWEYCPRQWYLHKTIGRRINDSFSRKGLESHNIQSQAVKAVQKEQSTFITATTVTIGGIICLYLFFWLLR